MKRIRRPLRILFVASEAQPWLKTGGLADAVAGLAAALAAQGHQLRLLLPAYGDVVTAHPELEALGDELLCTEDPATSLRTLFWRGAGFPQHSGNPYHDTQGHDWPDNWQRFGAFSRYAAMLAADRVGQKWRPDIVHCHDWQTGLVAVWMQLLRVPAGSVFTIHNLAYRGLYPRSALAGLGLPSWLWHADALEFHQHLSLIKGGLVFADRLTTVSPSYAREIQRPEHGQGLDGLLRHRADSLSGILNGIDEDYWNPTKDPALPAHFDASKLAGKRRCKQALRTEFELAADSSGPLLGMISRLVAQKGIDLVLQILPQLLARGCQLAILGSGDAKLEQALQQAARAHPGQIGLRLGFDEALAHRIEAGADLFLMPSRFEPCGLNQMYSQRYGSLPVVHATGGLADSVIDATPASLQSQQASGFSFEPATPDALLDALDRAIALWKQPRQWARLQRCAMSSNAGWSKRATAYLNLYHDLLGARG